MSIRFFWLENGKNGLWDRDRLGSLALYIAIV
jgi:hypothetical protein